MEFGNHPNKYNKDCTILVLKSSFVLMESQLWSGTSKVRENTSFEETEPLRDSMTSELAKLRLRP
jgi:hypothetical protein